jgi:hypothetical protein
MKPRRPRRVFLAAVWLWISWSLSMGPSALLDATHVTSRLLLHMGSVVASCTQLRAARDAEGDFRWAQKQAEKRLRNLSDH